MSSLFRAQQRCFSASSSSRPANKRLRAYPRLRVKHDDGTPEPLYRADRVLANRTGRSRSECTQLLKQRRVMLLSDDEEDTSNNNNTGDESAGVIVTGPSTKLSMHAPLAIDKERIPLLPPLVVAYHKPKWMLSVWNDALGRPCLNSCLSLIPQNMHPVGRLDYDSSGLLLFSSNGGLTQTLLHPRHKTPKEYAAVVAGKVDQATLQQQLQTGVATSDGIFSAELVRVTQFDDASVADYLKSVLDKLPPEHNRDELDERGHLQILQTATQLSTVQLIVHEGKYRMVRRMLANCGHPVVDLKRLRIGNVSINDLPEGEMRYLTKSELVWAHNLVPTTGKKGKSIVDRRKSDDSES